MQATTWTNLNVRGRSHNLIIKTSIVRSNESSKYISKYIRWSCLGQSMHVGVLFLGYVYYLHVRQLIN